MYNLTILNSSLLLLHGQITTLPKSMTNVINAASIINDVLVIASKMLPKQADLQVSDDTRSAIFVRTLVSVRSTISQFLSLLG